MQKKIIMCLLILNDVNPIFAVYNEEDYCCQSKAFEKNDSILLNEEKKVSQLNEKKNKLKKPLNQENFKMPIFLSTVIVTENFVRKFSTK